MPNKISPGVVDSICVCPAILSDLHMHPSTRLADPLLESDHTRGQRATFGVSSDQSGQPLIALPDWFPGLSPIANPPVGARISQVNDITYSQHEDLLQILHKCASCVIKD